MESFIGIEMFADFDKDALRQIMDAADKRARWLSNYYESEEDDHEADKIMRDRARFMSLYMAIRDILK